ncbi:MAG: hypothetical protein AB8B96_21245 [Lysobacterales bacterium]
MATFKEAFRDIRRRKVFRGMGVYVLAAWSVVQVADVVADPLGFPPWTVNALLFLAVLGFPLGIWVAWRYELSSDGLTRTQPASASTENTDLSLKFSDYAIFMAMVGVLGTIAWQGLENIRQQSDAEVTAIASTPSTLEAADNTIAVLPFSDLSPNADSGYLADGMSETVLHVLSKVEGLQVTSRTSSFAFRNQPMTASDIAGALGVAHLLEGSIQRSGDQIRVIATVIDARNGIEIWSENFDRGINAMFVIQDEIARSVAAALMENVAAEQPVIGERYRPTLKAFEQYILAKKEIDSATTDDALSAIKRLEKAIELDPDYALAYVGLAKALRTSQSAKMDYSSQAAQRIESLVETALQLDPVSAEAWVMRSFVQAHEKDFKVSMQSLRRALEINPNLAEAHHALSNAMLFEGDKDLGLAAARKAAELDPESQTYQTRLAGALWSAARAEEAIATLRDLIERHPENTSAYMMMTRFLSQFGKTGEAMRYVHAARQKDPNNMAVWKQYCEQYFQLWDTQNGVTCYQQYAAANPDDVDGLKWVAVAEQDYPKAVRIAKQEIERSPSRWYPKLQMAGYLSRLGDWQQIIDVLGSAFPQLVTENPKIDDLALWPARELALAYYRVGKKDQGQILADAVLAYVERSRKQQAGGWIAGTEDAMIHAIVGDAEACFAALRSLMDSGWSFYAFTVPDEPAFDSVRDDKRWQEFMDYLARKTTEQREYFLNNQDLPLS